MSFEATFTVNGGTMDELEKAAQEQAELLIGQDIREYALTLMARPFATEMGGGITLWEADVHLVCGRTNEAR